MMEIITSLGKKLLYGSKDKQINYYWLRDELKEATYHLTAPLSAMHGTCAKMIFTYMDYIVGDITYEEMDKIVRECQAINMEK